MKQSRIASADGALAFIFGIFALLIWYCSVFTGIEDATLFSIALVWLLLCMGALIASLINMVRGSSGGNTNLLGTILLGLIPGIDTLAACFFRSMHLSYQPEIYGVVYLLGAVFILAAAIRRKDRARLVFFRTFSVGVGFLFLAIGDLFSLRFVSAAGGWVMLVYAILNFSFGLHRLYAEFGEEIQMSGRSSSPQGIVSFICAVFGMLGFELAFFSVSNDSILAAGIVRLILGGIYFISALINLFKGSPFGNLNLIFAVCFGLFAGSNMLIQALGSLLHVSMQPMIYTILQMAAGLYLFLLLPAFSNLPLYRQCTLGCSGFALICSALNGFSGIVLFNQIGGLVFFAFAMLNVYGGLCFLLPDHFHEGKSYDQLKAKRAKKTAA